MAETKSQWAKALISTVLPLIAACQPKPVEVRRSDDRICSAAPATVEPGQWASCIHRWAYRLAKSPDPAEVVAKAAVAACSDAVAWQVNNAKPEDRTQLLADIMRSAPDWALFRVVQARAGSCDIPT